MTLILGNSFFKLSNLLISLAAKITFILFDAQSLAKEELNPGPTPIINANSDILYDDKCFSASSAAIQPIPAALTACLKILSLTSPAAKTPGIFVSVESGFVVK